LQVESTLKNQQASFQVEPRVFYEDFKNYVLYVQDIRPGTGAARWQRIFLADLSDPTSPKITTAEDAVVADSGAHTILMRLRNGTEHEQVSDNGAPQYQVSTFLESTIPLTVSTHCDRCRVSKENSPVGSVLEASISPRSSLTTNVLPSRIWTSPSLTAASAAPLLSGS